MSINSLFYLGLAILSLLLLIYICFKKGFRRSLLLFIAMVGLGYGIEAVIYNFLRSYQYYPDLIKNNPIYDSNLGAIASNALALPAAAVFIASYRKNWLWIGLIIGIFAAIEWLFLKLNIYFHNWWKIGYTSLGLPVYFTLAKVWYKKMARPLIGFRHTLLLFLIIGPFSGTIQFLPMMLFSNRYYQLGWFENRSSDSTAFAAAFYLCSCLFYVAISKVHIMPIWLKYVVTASCMYAANFMLQEAGILHSLVWWDIWFYVILSTITLRFTETISKRLSNGPKAHNT
ncbi:hypothetical protein ACFVSW_07560 [Neobacillus sp. NPDC058068]|uniref:hypothetical protein n=1 Tax=Neobacillus sp. NPDC058068 TaxID=3346325 RepID=UPI0036D7D3F9